MKNSRETDYNKFCNENDRKLMNNKLQKLRD